MCWYFRHTALLEASYIHDLQSHFLFAHTHCGTNATKSAAQSICEFVSTADKVAGWSQGWANGAVTSIAETAEWPSLNSYPNKTLDFKHPVWMPHP